MAKDRYQSTTAEDSFQFRIDRKLVRRPLEKQQGNNGTEGGSKERTILVKSVTYVTRAHARP